MEILEKNEKRSITLSNKTIELPEKMIQKINFIDSEFKRVSETLNNQLSLLIEGFVMSQDIPENSNWKLSDDKKSLIIE